jgi:predicted phosphohydrolase
MELAFDLISDLHLESWQDNDWTGRATSQHCVVAGDVCKDRADLIKFLRHLGTCYQGVFYIDGNDEHKLYMDKLSSSYRDLASCIRSVPNVIYLQDNVVVINGVAIVGTNGWWSFDFDLGIDAAQSRLWLEEKENYSTKITEQIKRASSTDANYMLSSIKRLQTHPDVKKIVVVTHTVPRPDLIEHDPTIEGLLKFNVMGNRYLQVALNADTEHKIHTWCFGHYHNKIDQYRDGIRWVNNCRGRQHTDYAQWAYNPLRIVVDY